MCNVDKWNTYALSRMCACSEIDRVWALSEGPGRVTHRGNREAGLSGSGPGAGYFLLMKDSSAGPNTFTAVSVSDWYNFRQVARCTAWV